jgi:hypothetical protein
MKTKMVTLAVTLQMKVPADLESIMKKDPSCKKDLKKVIECGEFDMLCDDFKAEYPTVVGMKFVR